ncbi:MAG TPA: hypothetical protein PLE30_01665 [Candidatus Kapabacteria bacterium]|nr:hypothetical protein [Candidatus Kapabacteria bacterium]
MKKFSEYLSIIFTNGENSVSFLDWILSHRFLLLLFFTLISAFLIVLVINVRNVNEILANKRELEKSIKIYRDNNAQLHSKIISLQAAERIIPFAEQNLQMYLPADAPKVIRRDNGR